MSIIKKLAGQTAVYGLSSIVGRLLNYLLVPLYTYRFLPSQYGVVTELYAYAGFLIVLFTYGMETAFFRFNDRTKKEEDVYGTAMSSILLTTIVFSGLIVFFAQPIAHLIHYELHVRYIIFFALIIGFDAITALPFARLRADNRPMRFATVKILNICINAGLNLFFILLCPYILSNPALSALHGFINSIYHPEIGVAYIFISNLVSSIVTALVLLPEISKSKWGIDRVLLKKMLRYALPLILVGLAGIINETLDRAMLKFMLPYSIEKNTALLGIYGANYKLAILLTLFIQAFRYAAEPFFFQQANKKNARILYAKVLNYFMLVGMSIFLFIMLYIDILKYFIGPKYHEGLKVVPILLGANLMLGIYYNLSVWYKLTDKTHLGAYIAGGGALITIVLNYIWIPQIGYMGSAWATLICYASMAIASFWVGKRYYPVPYNVIKIATMLFSGMAIYFFSKYYIDPYFEHRLMIKMILHTFIFIGYVISIYLLVSKPSAAGIADAPDK